MPRHTSLYNNSFSFYFQFTFWLPSFIISWAKTDNTLSYGWLILTRSACEVFWGVKCKNPKKGQTTRIRSFHLSDLEWTLHKHQLPWWLRRLATDKNSHAKSGDLSSTPGVGRSPGKGNGNPLQHSCLEYSMNKETWWPYSQWSHKSQTPQSMHAHTAHTHLPRT